MGKTEKPWGSYEVIEQTPSYWKKIIQVDPNKRLSLQYHIDREEDWEIMQGNGSVQIGEKLFSAGPGDKFHISKGEKHRIMAGDKGMSLEEIAHGKVDENDIIRLEDDYGRVGVKK
ncbi:MAG TPA: phosphomannose isomerase type II C-terminal cupin domain [Candidatus Nanoarchaeia archaeon]|nr:phosphomannose isomerase type II C-terminal cupin domain [Candidatus Nanoarchaeia archaeon]